MNKRKVLRVLRKAGSLICGQLTRGSGTPERCSVGCLLYAAGVTDEEMRKVGYYGDPTFKKVLSSAYNMTAIQAHNIVGFNDSAHKSSFAKDCKFRTPNTQGAQARRNKARACIVIKEIERMEA